MERSTNQSNFQLPQSNATTDTITAINDQSDALSMQMVAFLWFAAVLFCVCAKPNIPDASHRRYPEGVERQPRKPKKKEIDPEQRRRLIEDAILFKKVTGRDSNGVIILKDVTESSQSTSSAELEVLPKTEIVPDACEEYVEDEDVTCMICLEPFNTGDNVAWSRDLKCSHIFHSDCILPWLMKRDECPCCRTNFINGESVPDDDKSTGSGHTTDDETDEGSQSSGDNEGAYYIIDGLVTRVRSAGYTLIANKLSKSSISSTEFHRDGVSSNSCPVVNIRSLSLIDPELANRPSTCGTSSSRRYECTSSDDEGSVVSSTAISSGDSDY